MISCFFKRKETGMAGQWTEERRKAAADRCRANKPWEQSTGPKTTEGKIRSSLNALKTADHSHTFKHAREALRLQRLFLKEFELFNRINTNQPKEDIIKEIELIRIKEDIWNKWLIKSEINAIRATIGEGAI